MGLYHLSFVFVFISVCFSAVVPVHKAPRAWQPSNHHTRSIVENGELRITVALTQRNLDVLEERFWAVSDPANPSYGKYMTFSEVTTLVAPDQSAIDAVTNWFVSNGIPRENVELHEARDVMFVKMTVPQMESVFQTSLAPYVHKKTGSIAMHMDSYTIPEHVSAYVDYVSDLNSLLNIPRVELEVSPRKTFVPPKLTLVSEKVTPSTESALAPRATSSAPFMRRQYTGNSSLTWEGIILCSDGTTPSTSLTCSGGVTLTKIFIELHNNVTGAALLLSGSPSAACYICNEQDLGTYCTSWASAVGVNARSIFCILPIGATFVKNYVPYNMRIWTQYSNGQNSSKVFTNAVQPSEEVSPQILFTTFGIPDGTVVTNPNNNQSVAAFNGETYLKSDLQLYFSAYGLADYSNLASTFAPANMQNQATEEASLDMQGIMAVARNCKTVFWDMSQADSSNFPYSWIHQVLAASDAPLVHSVSYGISEYVTDWSRSDAEFMKAGVRGLTVLVSSGDDGVYSNDPSEFNQGYVPDYPASSPYITSVGATMLWGKTTPSCYDAQGNYVCTGATEVVATPALGAIIASGGGFSNQFARPKYQDSIISAYLGTLPTSKYPANKVNRSSRAYPDISALGHNVPIFVNAKGANLDGTSASSPFMAGFVTLLNDIRLNNGKSPMGFLNPFIYSLPSNAFNDITIGSNDCSTDFCPGPAGFPAQAGYDAVTGLGTPVWSVWADKATPSDASHVFGSVVMVAAALVISLII